ncbi:RIO1 family regulatory kinase/ATPase [Myxococcus eversor]|uniref:RIO1 family regulatory kinase/ATPase domain-containing protein n=1 Tax=Myxococcus eversor TaxID=2709661 RepID=UPI0013D69D17|nr:RIO1 family regulatory kinase/ATPase [Myxococcus eversor]
MNDSLETLLADGIIEAVIGQLKTGKEAEVWLVQHAGQVVAAKLYKQRHERNFRNNVGYREGREVRNSRTRRAMEKGSRFGQAASEEAWKSAEADSLYKLHGQGVRVPTPVMFYEGILLMELVLDAQGQPAPRLVEAPPATPDEAQALYVDLRAQVVSMLCADLIHGDLSPYNILMGYAGPTIIDFPQTIAAARNNRAEFYFRRDLDNVREFLAGTAPWLHGASGDTGEIWAAYNKRELTPDFVPSGTFRDSKRRAGAGRPDARMEGGNRRRDFQPEPVEVLPEPPKAPMTPEEAEEAELRELEALVLRQGGGERSRPPASPPQRGGRRGPGRSPPRSGNSRPGAPASAPRSGGGAGAARPPQGGAQAGGPRTGPAEQRNGSPRSTQVEQRGGPRSPQVEQRGGPRAPQVEQRGSPRAPQVEQRGGPRSPPVEQRGGPRSLPVEQRGGPRSPQVEQRGGPRSPPVEQRGGPRSPPVEQRGGPRSPQVEQRGGPRSPPVEQRASGDSPNGSPRAAQGEPRNGVTGRATEDSRGGYPRAADDSRNGSPRAQEDEQSTRGGQRNGDASRNSRPRISDDSRHGGPRATGGEQRNGGSHLAEESRGNGPRASDESRNGNPRTRGGEQRNGSPRFSDDSRNGAPSGYPADAAPSTSGPQHNKTARGASREPSGEDSSRPVAGEQRRGNPRNGGPRGAQGDSRNGPRSSQGDSRNGAPRPPYEQPSAPNGRHGNEVRAGGESPFPGNEKRGGNRRGSQPLVETRSENNAPDASPGGNTPREPRQNGPRQQRAPQSRGGSPRGPRGGPQVSYVARSNNPSDSGPTETGS